MGGVFLIQQGDLVQVTGFTSVIDAIDQIGIILEVFVNDNAAWILFPSIGKQYINLKSLTLLNKDNNEK